MTREEYDGIDAINYSTLSKLHTHPKNLLLPSMKSKDMPLGMRTGSLIDCLSLSPEDYETKFFMTTSKLPGDAMMNLLEQYLQEVGEVYYPINESAIAEANKVIHYGGKWSIAVVTEKFKDSCDSYLQELEQAGSRIIIDSQLYSKCSAISKKVTLNPFVLNNITTDKGLYGNKVYIVWDQELPSGTFVKCKAELDNLALIPVETAQEVYVLAKINDLKYDSGEWGTFGLSFLKWNYHLQVAMYILAAQALNKESTWCSLEGAKELIAQRGNTIKRTFKFIVANEGNEPLIYPASSDEIRLGFKGGIVNGIKKKGVWQLIDELMWHRETGYYELPKDIYDHEGEVGLNLIY